MAWYDYASIRKKAYEKLKKYGFTATLKRTIPGSGPAWNPGTPTEVEFTAIDEQLVRRFGKGFEMLRAE